MNSTLRITGLATGLDVDELVKSLMKAENTRLDKLKQERQLVEWKQETYRDILGDINTFKSTYFDVLKSDTYMLSSDKYVSFDVKSVDSLSSTAQPTATATAGAGAAQGTYSVVVKQLAEPAVIKGSSISNNRASINLDEDGYINKDNWSQKVISFTVDGGESVDLTLPDYEDSQIDLDTLIGDINDAISQNDSLKGKVTAVKSGNNAIQFVTSANNVVKLSENTTAEELTNGITVGRAINPVSSTKLSDIGITEPVTFKITYGSNEITVTAEGTDTISSFANKISRASSSQLTAKYSELTGVLSIQTDDTGSSANISIEVLSGEEADFFGITGTDKGQDAVVQITPPGSKTSTTVIKSSNSFVIDGMTYSLKSADSTRTTTITVSANPQAAYDRIKAFVDKYNEIVEKIQTKLNEKKQYAYSPLTDEQKEEMSEDQIKKWEDKAKEGILKGDSSLQNMLYSLRRAFYDSVEGVGISLKEVGLSTGDYSEGGKIIIDEQKLKEAIEKHGDQVADLFSKKSSIDYDPDHKKDSGRYNQVGIFQRINDILKDYTRTTRDSNGRKGILIEKAGIKGDLSEIENLLSKELKDNYDKRIKELTEKLAEKEEKYYEQFSRLETAIQKMNEQSLWLSQQFGG